MILLDITLKYYMLVWYQVFYVQIGQYSLIMSCLVRFVKKPVNAKILYIGMLYGLVSK